MPAGPVWATMQQRRIKGMHMLCSWWICSIFVSMSASGIHCARPRAKITKNLMFLMRHYRRETSRLKPQFVSEHLYFSRFLGAPLLKFIYYWIHFYHSILIMVLRYVYKYDRFLFLDNLPNALCCSALIQHK